MGIFPHDHLSWRTAAGMWKGVRLHTCPADGPVPTVIVSLEIGAALLGCDCLTFTTLQLIYPPDVTEAYQQAINPHRMPGR